MSLVKLAATNPMQMGIQKILANKNPMAGLHYDRLTALAQAAKKNPTMLPKMREAAKALKATGGAIRQDAGVKQGILSAVNKPPTLAQVVPFRKAPTTMVATRYV